MDAPPAPGPCPWLLGDRVLRLMISFVAFLTRLGVSAAESVGFTDPPPDTFPLPRLLAVSNSIGAFKTWAGVSAASPEPESGVPASART